MPTVIENIDVGELEKSLGRFIQDVTIRVAEQALTEAVRNEGFTTEPIVVTDGVVRRDYHQVRIGGKIEFIAQPMMATVVMWAMNELWKVSPIKTRRYINSHVVLINGIEVTSGLMDALRKVSGTDRVQIVNPQPYAKKIEGRAGSRKKGGGMKGLSPQAPNGVYRVVLKRLVQVFGKSMFFDFKYVKLNSAAKVWGFAGGRQQRNVKAAPRRMLRDSGGRFSGTTHPGRVRRDAVYPALQFYIKPTGVPN